jgi:hypothetical protein
MMFIGTKGRALCKHFELDAAREVKIVEVTDWALEFSMTAEQRVPQRQASSASLSGKELNRVLANCMAEGHSAWADSLVQ